MSGRSAALPALGDGARVALVVNPAARRGRDRALLEPAIRALRGRYEVDLVLTEDAAAVETAVHRATSQHDAIVVAGGDGTLNRALNGLAGSPTPLGLIPLGTGNDFARAFGIQPAPMRAAGRIVEGRVRAVDLIQVNDRVYGTVGVIGVPSDITLAVLRHSAPGSSSRRIARLLGAWSYRIAALYHLAKPGLRPMRVRIGTDDGQAAPAISVAYGVFVANTRILGGGLTLPIDSDEADGYFDIVVVSHIARARLLWAFLCFAKGWRIPAGTIQTMRAAHAEFLFDDPVSFSADGELMGQGATFTVSIRHHALRLIV
ncbi:MAG: YegS/Rv2252/BmrU family lipid kinase [Acidobacteria bacterium]|nr:YegS/Rv2252/BmrU family lipid kinase [Acidobacteriota bacterium]